MFKANFSDTSCQMQHMLYAQCKIDLFKAKRDLTNVTAEGYMERWWSS